MSDNDPIQRLFTNARHLHVCCKIGGPYIGEVTITYLLTGHRRQARHFYLAKQFCFLDTDCHSGLVLCCIVLK